VEVLSALSRRRTAGELTQRDFLAIKSRLHKDRAYWELVEVGPIVLSQAEELVQRAGLRTLDALHVASALTFQAASGLTIPFVTADVRQRDAAESLALNLIWIE
jgi:predicted nucleic acid-binding protein